MMVIPPYHHEDQEVLPLYQHYCHLEQVVVVVVLRPLLELAQLLLLHQDPTQLLVMPAQILARTPLYL